VIGELLRLIPGKYRRQAIRGDQAMLYFTLGWEETEWNYPNESRLREEREREREKRELKEES
jgi:hypothetical protein